jgi:hypothetical protein
MSRASPDSQSTAGVAVAVTPHASTNFAEGECRALYVGVAGDVTGIVNGAVVTFTAAPVGVLPVRFTRINAVATTATNMVALY